ncbi:hypothetical protein [Micromonospora purpureochromogenes]|uniref:Uncharacterized protein n=1 Tax=Micromonospora purpureochromogenes TaxID=47872 RepID=A0ABX2RGW9_9ACTN|nr:hypothetical protein [Micromonospora purpureochromogenes]NYF54446.1 hypothetical protein [Micromonospora purpureochromogenes]
MSTPDSEPEQQFLDLTEGSRGLAKLLYESLSQLRDGVAGDDLQEMARDVLAGRTDLREIAGTDAYGGMLLDGFRRFTEWEASLDPEEKQRLAAGATAAADALDMGD